MSFRMHSCPVGGMMCLDCEYPINRNEKMSYVEYMGTHEKRLHGGKSSIKDRKARLQLYEDEVKKQATTIQAMILNDKKEEAKQLFFNWIGAVEQYYYCSHEACQQLVPDKKHSSNEHQTFCNTLKDGIKSSVWNKNSPIIIPIDDFDFNKPHYVSKTFWRYFNGSTTTIDQKCICGRMILNNGICSVCNVDSNNSLEVENVMHFQQYIQQQNERFEDGNRNAIVRPINQCLTPNLWIQHTGWHRVILNYSYREVYEAVTATPTPTQQKMIDCIEKTLWDTLKKLEGIEPSHHIMHEVHRRSNDDTRRPFRVALNSATWKKYFNVMKQICSIFIKLAEK
jgi:hypothetical protein